MMPTDTPGPAVTGHLAESDALSAGLGASKGAENLGGFTPPYEIPFEEPKPSSSELPVIIGFDAEWVEEPDEPSDDPDAGEPTDPAELPQNLVLSYQYACRFAQHEWCGIVYTRAGARIRFPDQPDEKLAAYAERMRFADLLGEAISAGTRSGHLRKWPKHVIAAAHWTRADLSAMADFAEIKNQFDGVQKTYVSLERRFEARTLAAKHSRKFYGHALGHPTPSPWHVKRARCPRQDVRLRQTRSWPGRGERGYAIHRAYGLASRRRSGTFRKLRDQRRPNLRPSR